MSKKDDLLCSEEELGGKVLVDVAIIKTKSKNGLGIDL
jgi:hypothetical protein